MKTPARSAAIAKALASQPVGLPEDFAARVATLAEGCARRKFLHLGDAALLGAFCAMLGICLAGWASFAPQQFASAEWLGRLTDAAVAQPWLSIGVAGLGAIQALAFGRRVRM